MATIPDLKNLELSVTDFGPIAKAKIDLRPLTVFVGPSNTGKSYMAVLIYALHQFFSNLSRRRMMQLQALICRNMIFQIFLLGRKKRFPDLETNEHEESCLIELPESIAVLIHTSLKNVAHLSEDLENEIARCFGVGKTKNLVRHPGNGKTTFSLLHNISREAGQNDPLGYTVTVTEQRTKIDALIPNTMPLKMDIEDLSALLWNWNADWLIELENFGLRKIGSTEVANWNVDWLAELKNEGEDEKAKHALIELLRILASDIISEIVGPLSHPAYNLPADRAGVMHAHQVAVRGLIASASRVALRRDRQCQYFPEFSATFWKNWWLWPL